MTRRSEVIDTWLATKEARYREQAHELLARMAAKVGKAEVSVDKHGILGFGRGSDGFPLLALAVRRDGLRLYANIFVLMQHKAALGKTLTGKSASRCGAPLTLTTSSLRSSSKTRLALRQYVKSNCAVNHPDPQPVRIQ